MDRLIAPGKNPVAQETVQALPSSARLEDSLDAGKVGGLVGRLAVRLMVQHRIKTAVGKRHVHEIPVMKLDQMVDSPLLRSQCHMRLAIRQSDVLNPVIPSQPDGHSAHASAGIEHPPLQRGIATSHQGHIGAQKSFPVRLRL